MAEIKAVEHVAEIRQVKTMADGTFNVTLNLPEYCEGQASVYFCNTKAMIKIVGVIIETPEEKQNGKGKRKHEKIEL